MLTGKPLAFQEVAGPVKLPATSGRARLPLEDSTRDAVGTLDQVTEVDEGGVMCHDPPAAGRTLEQMPYGRTVRSTERRPH